MKAHFQLQWLYNNDSETSSAPRVLIDRLWPHGRTRSELSIDHWWPEAAPSNSLKREWTQEKMDWQRFARRYRDELHTDSSKTQRLLDLAQQQAAIIMISQERDPEQSWPHILQEFLTKALDTAATSPPSNRGAADGLD
ncbi:DUF488 family protein [Marinospirillum sp. MEB164]|uniref:DUF488 family protein n=1 Tax=Marinospirillum alkalitolerans TaxID=3123374 RepID=A0ABW8PY73_9GAMM